MIERRANHESACTLYNQSKILFHLCLYLVISGSSRGISVTSVVKNIANKMPKRKASKGNEKLVAKKRVQVYLQSYTEEYPCIRRAKRDTCVLPSLLDGI